MDRRRRHRRVRYSAALLVAVLALSGCKEILYSDLTETEANEMTTLLEASGIQISRKRDKDGVYQVLVKEDQVGAANAILVSNGLPRKKFATMDKVFDAQGLVGSPFEERVRYIFALEEKLTEAVVSIHGVRDARVTVSLPEKSRLGKSETDPSASIILHYEADFEVGPAIPKIKTLIANSVQGLAYDGVSVVSFPAQSTSAFPGASGGSLLISAAYASESQPQNRPELSGAQTTLSTIVAGLLFAITLLACLKLGLGVRSKRGV